MDENTHEFFTELTEPGTYRVQVATLSSSGDCEARESAADTAFTFYLSTSAILSLNVSYVFTLQTDVHPLNGFHDPKN